MALFLTNLVASMSIRPTSPRLNTVCIGLGSVLSHPRFSTAMSSMDCGRLMLPPHVAPSPSWAVMTRLSAVSAWPDHCLLKVTNQNGQTRLLIALGAAKLTICVTDTGSAPSMPTWENPLLRTCCPCWTPFLRHLPCVVGRCYPLLGLVGFVPCSVCRQTSLCPLVDFCRARGIMFSLMALAFTLLSRGIALPHGLLSLPLTVIDCGLLAGPPSFVPPSFRVCVKQPTAQNSLLLRMCYIGQLFSRRLWSFGQTVAVSCWGSAIIFGAIAASMSTGLIPTCGSGLPTRLRLWVLRVSNCERFLHTEIQLRQGHWGKRGRVFTTTWLIVQLGWSGSTAVFLATVGGARPRHACSRQVVSTGSCFAVGGWTAPCEMCDYSGGTCSPAKGNTGFYHVLWSWTVGWSNPPQSGSIVRLQSCSPCSSLVAGKTGPSRCHFNGVGVICSTLHRLSIDFW